MILIFNYNNFKFKYSKLNSISILIFCQKINTYFFFFWVKNNCLSGPLIFHVKGVFYYVAMHISDLISGIEQI